MNGQLWKVALAVVLIVSIGRFAHADPIRPGFDSNTLARNDDASTGLVPLGFTVNFFGQTHTGLYVNNNGNVTFDQPLPAFTPFDLTSTNRQIIAPFFADVDTRNLASGEVTYGAGIVDGRAAFGVNWLEVGYFFEMADKLNAFQLVLIDRSDTGAGNFDIEFNYRKIRWETGDFSGGINGLGGDSARVGYSNGTGAPGTFFELPGSAVNGAFLDSNLITGLIHNSLNSGVPGQYRFHAREGGVEDPTVVPLPAAVWGGLSLMGLMGAYRLRRRTVGA